MEWTKYRGMFLATLATNFHQHTVEEICRSSAEIGNTTTYSTCNSENDLDLSGFDLELAGSNMYGRVKNHIPTNHRRVVSHYIANYQQGKGLEKICTDTE